MEMLINLLRIEIFVLFPIIFSYLLSYRFFIFFGKSLININFLFIIFSLLFFLRLFIINFVSENWREINTNTIRMLIMLVSFFEVLPSIFVFLPFYKSNIFALPIYLLLSGKLFIFIFNSLLENIFLFVYKKIEKRDLLKIDIVGLIILNLLIFFFNYGPKIFYLLNTFYFQDIICRFFFSRNYIKIRENISDKELANKFDYFSLFLLFTGDAFFIKKSFEKMVLIR